MSDFVPFSVREGHREFTFVQGFPPALANRIHRWINKIDVLFPVDVVESMALSLQIMDFDRYATLNNLFSHALQDSTLALDVLELSAKHAAEGEKIAEFFDLCKHEYKFDTKLYKFVPRVLSSQVEALKAVLSQNEIVGGALLKAWLALFTHRETERDPNVCWHSCIKALEAAYAPLVTPNDAKPTLGKIRAALRDGSAKFVTPLTGGVDFIVAALELVGYEPGRHQDGKTAKAATEEQAEMVLFTTITLCSFAVSPLISRAAP
ncbi:hypothetical protein [Canibacter oris]|uniref:Uncharacterized protein n=1 Tax=Canibacter oris TaxID=1365628 RepID=A0A840DK53_9MICO|nr:hypothetical protein [Canibacter oris]MBB4072073.1 hypothetical protein [Canibacter oris]